MAETFSDQFRRSGFPDSKTASVFRNGFEDLEHFFGSSASLHPGLGSLLYVKSSLAYELRMLEGRTVWTGNPGRQCEAWSGGYSDAGADP